MMELTFNWVYADSRSIAQFTSGRLPVRPATVDPGLPTKGTGDYEWQGFLPASAHAQTINPASGVILNWNNKPARGTRAPTTNGRGARCSRVDLLWGGISGGRSTRSRASSADERRRDAGLCGSCASGPCSATCSHAEPARRVGGGGSTARCLARSRRQPDRRRPRRQGRRAGRRGHGRGVEHDRRRRLRPCSGSERGRAREARAQRPAAPATARAPTAAGGRYVQKDLRSLLGRAVSGPYQTRFCGGGDVAKCARFALGGARHRTAPLAAAQGADPSAWRADATAERINFTPGILTRTMRGRTSRRSSRRSASGAPARTPPREGRGVGSGAMADARSSSCTPGPTSVPPDVLRARRSRSPPPLARLQPLFAARAGAAAARSSARRTRFSSSRRRARARSSRLS